MAPQQADPFAAFAEPPATVAHDHPIAGDPFSAYAEPPSAQSMASHAPQALQPPPANTLGLGARQAPAQMRGTTFRDRLNDVIAPDTQRMVGGMAGATAATLAMPEVAVPSLVMRAAAAAAPVVGAALGGGATAAAQGTSIPGGAAEQAGMEVGGKVIAWPINAVMRRVVAPGVAKTAASALETSRGEVNRGLDEVLQRAEGAVRQTREGVAGANARAGERVRGAKAGVREAGAQLEASTAKAAGQWPKAGEPPMAVSHGPQAPPGPEAYAATGRKVASVIQGPAKHSLDRLGQNVEASAAGGPAIDFAPIKQTLEAMAANARPSTMAGEGPPAVAGLFGKGSSAAEQSAFVEKLKAAGVAGLDESHPLPGVLSAIQNAPDTISFADAHKYKRMLDDAVNWDSPAKKQLQGMTKGIRGALRSAMGGHEPYNQATEAYRSAAPLFTKGYAKQVVRSAVDNPEGIAKLVKPDEPTKLQMLYDVLHEHAAAGGGASEGGAAWDGVRSAVTWKRLIQPGIEKFDESLGKFHPESQALLYGDPDGQAVLDHLGQISAAFKQAQQAGEAGVAGAKAEATAATEAAGRTKDRGAAAVAQRQSAAAQTKAQVQPLRQQAKGPEEAFKASSLANVPPPGQVVSDVLHATATHGMGIFKARAIGRMLMGPAGKDLVQYAAYSGPKTQMLVKAITGPAPGMAVADLMRSWGIAGAQEELAISHQQGQPPATSAPQGPPR